MISVSRRAGGMPCNVPDRIPAYGPFDQVDAIRDGREYCVQAVVDRRRLAGQVDDQALAAYPGSLSRQDRGRHKFQRRGAHQLTEARHHLLADRLSGFRVTSRNAGPVPPVVRSGSSSPHRLAGAARLQSPVVHQESLCHRHHGEVSTRVNQARMAGPPLSSYSRRLARRKWSKYRCVRCSCLLLETGVNESVCNIPSSCASVD